MRTSIGMTIKELYEQKLKEAKARFALMEQEKNQEVIPEEGSSS